jgi:hypothetical protein
MYQWMDVLLLNGWIENGWKHGWMDGWMDGWLDK